MSRLIDHDDAETWFCVSNGETYEGKVVREDDLRIWLEIPTGKTFCIWKQDIMEAK